MILVVTLLFAFILTALVLNSIESGLIENKLALNFKQGAIVFAAAQSELMVREAIIRGDRIKLPATKVTINCQEKLIAIDKCNKKRYQISVTARYQMISVQLVAIYNWLGRADKLACKNEVGGGQLYWAAFR